MSIIVGIDPSAMAIAVDIDSTLHHYWDLVAASAKRRFGVDLPYEDQRTWNVGGPARGADARRRRRHARRAGDPRREPVPRRGRDRQRLGATRATSSTSPATARGAAHAATARWLAGIGLRYDELYCSYDKITRAVEIGIGVLVDDSPVNLLRALEHGIRPATIAHPWNRDALRGGEDVVCARDWPALGVALEPVLSGAVCGMMAIDGRRPTHVARAARP